MGREGAFSIIVRLTRKEQLSLMYHPPKKPSKTVKNSWAAGTALVIGWQLPELPKFKEGRLRDTKHARSLVSKDKFVNRVENTTFEMRELKIDGREIASSVNIDTIKLRNKQKNTTSDKIMRDYPLDSTFKCLIRPKKTTESSPTSKQYEKQHSDIIICAEIEATLKQKENSLEDNNNALPDISPKEIGISSNYLTEKTSIKYQTTQRKSDREAFSIGRALKRRDTMGEAVPRVGYNGEQGKNKQESKKSVNLMQYREFIFTVNLTNRMVIHPEEEVLYKAYICKGNNGLLVKSILKTRPWWSFRASGEIDNCNLVWTEWKRNKSMNQLAQSTPREPVKSPQNDFSLTLKTNNQQTKLKMQKKYANFTKLLGKHTTSLSKKYDTSIMSENYLIFTAKISTKSFQDSLPKSLLLQDYTVKEEKDRRIANHVPGCFYLHSKKLLFQSMSRYYQRMGGDVFSVIPVTFLISKGLNDPEFQRFCGYFNECGARGKGEKKGGNVWICKPGENSNRGNGIQVVSSINEIRALASQKCGSSRTLIVQKYMENPFLYNKRKFDLRCYVLVSCVNGCVKGYWYQQSYVRTASKEYTLKNLDNKLIHLTNDAIQKKGEEYGKFENNNKVSLADLEKYIDSNTEVPFKAVYQRIKDISTQLIESVARRFNPNNREFSFELFGLDFMLDDKLNPFLIEANSNPCLEVDGNVLGRVIPRMVENVIRVAVDPVFPPPYSEAIRNKYSPGTSFETNQMVLVYDSLHDPSWQGKEGVEEEVLAEERECEDFEGEEDEE